MSRPELSLSAAAGTACKPLSCCAVIVSWQPDIPALQQLVDSLLEQGCAVRVVDNGSDNARQLAESMSAYPANFSLECWPKNRGLAAGLNAGLHYAGQCGYSYALLFDQDSQIGAGFVASLAHAWCCAERYSPLPVAAVGPRLQNPDTRYQTPFRKFRCWRRSDVRLPGSGTAALYDADFLITSGTLLSLAAVRDVGMMKEEYFIDNIDLEWCFRARATGYALYGTDAAVLHHRIGERSDNPLVTAGLMVSHSPVRLYYSTRNRLHLRRQTYAPRDWKYRDRLRLVLKSLYLLMFSRQRCEYWRQLRRGIRDARRMP